MQKNALANNEQIWAWDSDIFWLVPCLNKGIDWDNCSGRDNAIKKAISLLNNNDILLIAGKGHETKQTIGTESLPFDDFSVAKLAIENLKNGI